MTELRKRDIPVYNPRSGAFQDQEEIQLAIGTLAEVVDPGGSLAQKLMGRELTQLVADAAQAYRTAANAYPILAGYVAEAQKAIADDQRTRAFLGVSLRDIYYRVLSYEPFNVWIDDPERTLRLGKLSAFLESVASVHRGDTLKLDNEAPGKISEYWVLQVFYYRLLGYIANFKIDEWEDPEEPIPPGYIQVMTIHQAKGLQFPVVFVDTLGTTPRPSETHELEDALAMYRMDPIVLDTPDDRAVRDLTRQFYVAYSRAQHLLVLVDGRSAVNKQGSIALGVEG